MLPIAFLVLLFAFFSIEKFILSIAFFTPLAVTIKELGYQGPVDLSLPTEPLMAASLLLLFVYQLKAKIIDRSVLRHPVTIVIGLQLTWILFTSITSEMPLVSIKFFLARLWFVATAFFLTIWIFKKPEYRWWFAGLYLFSLCIVMVYTLVTHSQYGFDEESGHWVVSPFYNDHTAYGAALALLFPVIFGFLLKRETIGVFRVVIIGGIALFITAIIFSYARAAWVSLAASIGIFFTLLLRIRFSWLLSAALVLIVLFFSFQTEILIMLNKNDTDSDKDLANNVESISNINTDASNVERLNRWSCAIEMFKERPVLGWGPGTYMFQYAPFQKSSEKTIISVSDGSNGNAHSEYLGPLAEQGIIGAALSFLLMIVTFFMGYRLCYSTKGNNRILAYSIFLGLVTYFTHGFLNNFLDTDKLAVPFYGFLAILVSIDTNLKNESV